jgi:MATE family multidrug resistance protein
LPGGIYLAFHGWGLAGLWVGQCVALYLVGALEWVIVGLSDWEGEVERALERLDDGGVTSHVSVGRVGTVDAGVEGRIV